MNVRPCRPGVDRQPTEKAALLQRTERQATVGVSCRQPPHKSPADATLGVEQHQHLTAGRRKRIAVVRACGRVPSGREWPLRSHAAYDMLFPARDARLRMPDATPRGRTGNPMLAVRAWSGRYVHTA